MIVAKNPSIGAPTHAERTPIDVALGLLAVLVLILVNTFFVAGEFALLAVNRGKVEHLAASGDRRAGSALQALRTLSFQLSGCQLGITVSSLLVGFITEPTIGRPIAPIVDAVWPGISPLAVSTTIALILATAVQMVLGELIPKNYAIAQPLRLALAISAPLRLINGLFKPVITFLNAAANASVRLLGIEPQDELLGVRSVQELERIIMSSREGGALAEEEFALLSRSLSFGEKTADDALVPRVSIIAVKKSETVGDMSRTALRTGHSRFPVCGDDLDDIVGVAHVKDSYRIAPEKRATAPVTEIMQEPLFAPESRSLGSLLAEMRRERKHLAVVIDEYGGTAGIITLEDLLEEIVGDIEDEYDPREQSRQTLPPEGIHVVSGALHPGEIREATGFEMPEGDYETLAGFLLSLFKRIPDPGEQIEHEGWELKVVEMERKRIAQVLLVAPPRSEPEDETEGGSS